MVGDLPNNYMASTGSKVMKFKREYLLNELNLPDNAFEDRIVEAGRWTLVHEIIFGDNGKYYRTHYIVGATEYQDQSPWEYEDEVECIEVKQVIKPMPVWEVV